MTFGNESTASDADRAGSPDFLTPSVAEAAKKISDEFNSVRDEFRHYSGILVPSSSLSDFGPTNVQSAQRKMDTINNYPVDQLRQLLMSEFLKTDELERRVELYDNRNKGLERKLFQSEHVMKLQWELLLKLENNLLETVNNLSSMEKRRIALCTDLKGTEKQNKRVIAQLTSERDTYHGENESLMKFADNMKKTNAETARHAAELEDEVDRLRRQLQHFGDLQHELEEAKAREREQRSQCKDQNADLQRNAQDITNLQAHIVELEDHLRQTKAAYEQQIEDLRLAANKSNAEQVAAEREKYDKRLRDMDKNFVKAMTEVKDDNQRLKERNDYLTRTLNELKQGLHEWKHKEHKRMQQHMLEGFTEFIGRMTSQKASFSDSPLNNDFARAGPLRDMATHFMQEYRDQSNMSAASSASSVVDHNENRPPPASQRQANAGIMRSRSVDPVHRQRLKNVLQNVMPKVTTNRRSAAHNN